MRWVGRRSQSGGIRAGSLQGEGVLAAPMPFLLLLAPGVTQLCARQVRSGQFYAGGYLSALAVAILAWGTPLGLGMACGSFCLHTAALADAIRLVSLPAQPVGRIHLMVGILLGAVCYAPGYLALERFAHPVTLPGDMPERYLVDRGAYQSAVPQSGEWIWRTEGDEHSRALCRVLAGPDQTVELISGTWRINGMLLSWARQPRNHPLQDLAMRIPRDQLLVWSRDCARGVPQLRLLPISAVQGRVWFRQFPFQNGGFLGGDTGDDSPASEQAGYFSSPPSQVFGRISLDNTSTLAGITQHARPTLGPLACPVHSRQFGPLDRG